MVDNKAQQYLSNKLKKKKRVGESYLYSWTNCVTTFDGPASG